MKKPFLHALGAALYIVGIVLVGNATGSLLKDHPDTIAAPMTMLSLLTLSAAIMAYLFLYEPVQLLIENKRKEALTFFAKVVGFFACFVALFALLNFFI